MRKGPVLVTGAAGFIGSHLLDLLRQQKSLVPIIATSRRSKIRSHAPCDLTDAGALKRFLAWVRPSLIFHTAGRVRGTADELMRDNLLITSNLLSAAADLRRPPRVVVLGSAAEHGNPVDPYTWAKRCQTLLALQKAADGQDVLVVRLFNLLGPGLPNHFLAGHIAQQIAMLENKKGGWLRVGDMSTQRDFLDVRDAVRGILLATQRGHSGDTYEVCTGQARSVQDVLHILMKAAARPLRVKAAPSHTPPLIPVSKGNPRSIRALGWKPSISLDDSLRDTLLYYRSIHA